MRDIVLGSALLLSLIMSVYSTHSFFKAFNAFREESGPRLRKAALIVSLSAMVLETAMAVLCLVFLYPTIGKELVVFFGIAYAVAMVIVFFASRNSRFSGQIGDVHKRIARELIIYSLGFVFIFAIFMFGVFTAN